MGIGKKRPVELISGDYADFSGLLAAKKMRTEVIAGIIRLLDSRPGQVATRHLRR
ncbi:hypothetical protein [Motiliproteus sp. SC1-56]|uniref:hypothetical protein n=1 Tax=Motiliproteus sp. SC1-56 TaxID=2799565 RepID=UPI001A90C601|nr:hypothetical protein [Motiliproteus sp. SC1-56]